MKVNPHEAAGVNLSQIETLLNPSHSAGLRASKRLALGEGPLSGLQGLSIQRGPGMVTPSPLEPFGPGGLSMLQNLRRASAFGNSLLIANLASMAAPQQTEAAAPRRRKKRSLGSKIRGAFKKLGGGLKKLAKTGLNLAKTMLKQPFSALKKGLSSLLKGDLKGILEAGMNLVGGRLRMPMQVLKQLLNRPH